MARRSLQLPWWVKFKSRVKIEIYFVGHTWRDFNWFIFYCCSSNSNFPWRSVQITCTPLTLISNYALLCVVDLMMQACIACNAYGKNFKSIITVAWRYSSCNISHLGYWCENLYYSCGGSSAYFQIRKPKQNIRH